MTETELKLKLQKEYNHSIWKEILTSIFPKVDYFSQPIILAEKTDTAKSVRQIGNLLIADGNIGIFEVEVSSIIISRSRVKLREITAKYIDQDRINGAFVYYYSPGQEDYRFTFIAKKSNLTDSGEFVKFQTAPKRYTYVLGPNETGTTAAKRFLELEQKDKKAFDDIIQAFSVEKLNKEFFKKYKEQYEKFYKWLLNNIPMPSDSDQEKQKEIQKTYRNFVKLFLGRIVFLYFLQKKGWLGCPADKNDWKHGDKDFVYNLYKSFSEKNKFHSKCLSKLFFNALNNNDRPNSLFELTGTRVPYLNGGLFEDQFPDFQLIDFPSEYFDALFDFFSQYNFTINESDPEEHEVGIDPEMLGHIFENLLEENREKGAFYTPKEIVHFMCQESLIQYLVTNLITTISEDSYKKEVNASIDEFIRCGIANLIDKPNNFIRKNAKRIEELLDNIKICDPAIGSGAFPMGLLHEIFNAKMNLDWTLDHAVVKKNIIQNSIYGVDVDKGAVDIARLRFWLSLVVDEEEPQPLPNLDYKIMQGNSLLENYLGIDLKFEPAKLKIESYSDTDLFGRLINPQIEFTEFLQTKQEAKTFNITELEEKFFNSNKVEEKKIIRDKLDKFEREFIIEQLDKKLDEINSKLSKKNKDFDEFLKINDILFTQKPDTNKAKKDLEKALKQKQKFEKEIHQLNDDLLKIENGIEQIKTMKLEEKPYFLWHLYFMDVFHHGGFDIVIGNPPYIQLQKMGAECDALEQVGFETFTRTGDVYCLFYELGINLLKENGILTYITSNTWMRTKYGELLRNFFIKNSNPLKLINFEDTQIFQAATVETNIIVTQKSAWNRNLKAAALRSDYLPGTPLAPYFESNNIILNELNNDGWIILSYAENMIKNSIEESGIPLKHWDVQINFGIKTGFNDAFFIDETTKKELIRQDPKCSKIIKPLVRGREIRKFVYDFNSQYLIFTRREFNIDKYPSIKKFLEKYKLQLMPRPKNWNLQKDGEWKGRKPGDYAWYEFQDNIAFYKNFDEPKIIWLTITDKPAFAADYDKMYISSPAYIMSTPFIKYHLAILNSKVAEWYLDKVTSSTGQGANQWTKIFIEQIPIPQLDEIRRQPFELLTDYLIFLHSQEKPMVNPYAENRQIASVFEEVLNMCVYELYFANHMKEKEIDVLQFIDFPQLEAIKSEEDKAEIINNVYKKLQAQENPIRNRIILANIKSPDIIRRINSTTH